MKIIYYFFLALSLTAVPAIHAADKASRSIQDDVFVSTHEPVMKVRIDRRFSYVGKTEFLLKNIANCERHYWVDTGRDKTIRAMIVLQFEGFIEGVNEKYRFSIPEQDIAGANYRFTAKPVRLGNYDYVHNTWAFDLQVDARQNPGAESARTIEFLSAKGYKLDNELIMSRSVRAVGEDSRKEFIVFYMEPVRLHGYSIAEFPDGGPVSETYDRLSAIITERSRSSITFLSEGK